MKQNISGKFLEKNDIGILIISRLNSKRLYQKAKLKINKLTLIEITILRLIKFFFRKNLIICSSNTLGKSFYRKIAKKHKIKLFLGSDKNVLNRIIECMEKYEFKHFVRVTGDNVLVDPNSIISLANNHVKNFNDYTYTNCLAQGMECEVFSLSALKTCERIIKDPDSTEYLTYFFRRKEIFKSQCVKLKKYQKSENKLNICVDYFDQFKTLKNLLKSNNNNIFLNRKTVVNFLKRHKKTINLKSKVPLVTKKYDVRFKFDIKKKYINLN